MNIKPKKFFALIAKEKKCGRLKLRFPAAP